MKQETSGRRNNQNRNENWNRNENGNENGNGQTTSRRLGAPLASLYVFCLNVFTS